MIPRYLLSSLLIVAMFSVCGGQSPLPPRQANPEAKLPPAVAELAEKIEDLARSSQAQDAAARFLTELLDHNNPEVQWRAARAITRIGVGAPDTAAKLQKLATSKNKVVEFHAIRALAAIGDKSPTTIDTMMSAVTSNEGSIAREAIQALRAMQLPADQVAGAFAKAMASDNQAVASFAVEAAVDKGADATPLLIEALGNENSAYWAAVAISEIGPNAAGTVSAMIKSLETTNDTSLQTQLCLALAKVGKPALSASDAICALLTKSEDASVRMAGSYALGAIGATDCKAALEKCVECDDPFVAMVGSWALAKTTNSEANVTVAVDKLIAGLTSENPNMREAAAQGLIELAAPAEVVAPRLMAEAGKADATQRANLVDALAGLGDRVVPKAINGLEKPESRELAIEVLAKVGPKAAPAVPALIKLSESADESTSAQINYALGRIGPSAAAAVDALLVDIDSENGDLRQSALFALRGIGPAAKAAVPKLMPKTGTADGSGESYLRAFALASMASADDSVAKAILPTIEMGLANSNELIRLDAVMAVANLKEAGTPLRDRVAELAINDHSDMVRMAALGVLNAE